MNRAVHGDVVVVEVFPDSEWRAPGDDLIDQEGMFVSAFGRLPSSKTPGLHFDDCFLLRVICLSKYILFDALFASRT